MIDNFLLIPDAESLPLFRMAFKLACGVFLSFGLPKMAGRGGTAAKAKLCEKNGRRLRDSASVDERLWGLRGCIGQVIALQHIS